MTRLTLALLCMSACTSAEPEAETLEAREDRLEVEYTMALDLDEVSGIAVHPDGTLLAVGDASRRIAQIGDEYQLDDFFEADDGDTSQWEAVASDGRAFVLDESGDRIEVFGADGTSSSIALDMSDVDEWTETANAQGEGLVLLANGHVLVAKERGPSLIIELGPAGEQAQGYRPELALTGAFKVRATLVALHQWELHDSLADDARDLSEICVGPDKRLYALSDEGRAIFQLERELDPGENKIEARRRYPLPGSIDKPEGLVFPDGLRPVVADDNDNGHDDIYWLSPVEAP